MTFLKSVLCFLFVFSFAFGEERFLLIDGDSSETLLELGTELEERVSPCSTFKIALSLMGYDAKILTDEQTPVLGFKEGYDDFLDAWKDPQSPQSWMQYSCVWYSKLLSCQLGVEKMEDYLARFEYGNQDLSTGLVMPGKTDPLWFDSSPLKISPREQVNFIHKMLQNKLHVTDHATAKTRAILFKEDLPQGWKLFGKTGWSGSVGRYDENILEYAWFVGWVEKENRYFPFAYLVREKKIKLDQRIPRTIHLLNASGIMDKTSE